MIRQWMVDSFRHRSIGRITFARTVLLEIFLIFVVVARELNLFVCSHQAWQKAEKMLALHCIMVSMPNINCIVWNAAQYCVWCPDPVYSAEMLHCIAIIQSQVRPAIPFLHFPISHEFCVFFSQKKLNLFASSTYTWTGSTKMGRNWVTDCIRLRKLPIWKHIVKSKWIVRDHFISTLFMTPGKSLLCTHLRNAFHLFEFFALFGEMQWSETPRCTLRTSRTENSYWNSKNCARSSTWLDTLPNCDGQMLGSIVDMGKQIAGCQKFRLQFDSFYTNSSEWSRSTNELQNVCKIIQFCSIQLGIGWI